jgi:hypothetical protein
MSEIRAKWTAKVTDRLVAADGLIAGDSEEDGEEEEEDTEDRTTATRINHRLASGE